MALIQVEGAGVPTSYPLGDDGFVLVSVFSLSHPEQNVAMTPRTPS